MKQTLPESGPKPLGVFSDNEKIYLFSSHKSDKHSFLSIDISTDAVAFVNYKKEIDVLDSKGNKEDVSLYSSIRVSKLNTQYVMCARVSTKKQNGIVFATSKDLYTWHILTRIQKIHETAVLVSDFQYKGKNVLFHGDKNISLAYSADLKRWKMEKTVLPDGLDFFGESKLTVGMVKQYQKELGLFYFIQKHIDDSWVFAVNIALFDKTNPARLLVKAETTIWEQERGWNHHAILPLGLVEYKGQLVSFWHIDHKSIFSVSHLPTSHAPSQTTTQSITILKRLKTNPILKPITKHFWESKATFNPAALYDGGKVHLVYRAIGDHDISMLGYATSSDGFTIDQRYPDPIYIPTKPFEFTPYHGAAPLPPLKASGIYTSGGGGNGGCEDPRITRIGDRIYMTYVAYDGRTAPRIALTSIKADDFFKKNWFWSDPVLISKPGVVDKNPAILPEKVNGKYVIFHRIFPNILVDFVDSLDFDGNTFLKGEYAIQPRATAWDSRKVGVGPTPIKTKYGWLIVYHAVGDHDPSRYKMGAMITDLKDPTKVLFRTPKHILQPEVWYENEGHKYGVAYPCGMVNRNDELIIYYGAADMVTCAASAHLPTFLDELALTGTAKLEAVQRSPKTNDYSQTI